MILLIKLFVQIQLHQLLISQGIVFLQHIIGLIQPLLSVWQVQQKLAQHRPQTIGQASRIQGITPAAISMLLVYLKRGSLDASRVIERVVTRA